jgi:hypothetical protein
MYTNLNNPANYQLQDFGQFGFRVLDSSSMVVDGETYRTLYVLDDAVVSATSAKADDLVSKALLAGTLLHGLFSAPSVTSGKVLAYMAGRLTAQEILDLYKAYVLANGGTLELESETLSKLQALGTDNYADASLVLMPSGYKTSVLFSERPMDTDGQIAFTRASNATRVDANGLVEKVRTNLLLQSNQFDVSANWVNTSSTETGGQTGYDGSSNAWLLTKSTVGGRIHQNITGSGILTGSIYLKANASSWGLLQLDGTPDAYAYVDLINGVLGFTGSGNIDATITNVGGGWYRVSVVTNSTTRFRIYPAESDGDVSGPSGSIYIQDAQLEVGDITTDYIPTTTSARSTFAGTTVDGTSVPNLPRIDYSGTEGALLLEPQRTNLCLWSEQLDNAGWSKSTAGTSTISVTANYAVSPDGYKNADRIQLTRDAVGYAQASQTISISSGQSYTFSVYLKSLSGTPTIMFGSYGGTNAQTATLTNEWVRYTWTATSPSTSAFAMLMIWGGIGSTSTSADFLAWGYQFEQGSYATSYIPTLATSVTRVVDAAIKTGITNLIGQTEGTVFLDFVYDAANTANERFTISDGTSANRFFILITTGQILAFNGVTASLDQWGIVTSITVGQRYKIAGAYKANDIVFYVNGVQIGTDTSASIPTCSNLYFANEVGSGQEWNNLTNQLLLFKTRLSNDKLAALTTL